MTICANELFGSKRDKPAVRQVYGLSGQGKTVMLAEALRSACRSSKFGAKHRFVVFDVKHDGYESLAPPNPNVVTAIRQLNREKIAIIHPDIKTAKDELDDLIDFLFDASDYDPDFSATLVLEESSTFITAHKVPDQIKRMATQGRSKGLTLILVNQRALSNRWTDTQSSSITMFRLAIPDRKMLKERWGLIAEEIDPKLAKKKFSFAHFDLESLETSFYEPIKMPKNRTPIVKRRERYTSLFRNPFA